MRRRQRWPSFKLNVPPTALVDLRLLEKSPTARLVVNQAFAQCAVKM
jgi:hypothetical protein